ncbi:MAG: polysaccharide deacetylase family protein, partial [Clostridiales bacterium]|nr:polysaccharide deacetylase family protein [Clostridiales bacterium]
STPLFSAAAADGYKRQILESFIENNPDFSVDGARATLCVNGYNGILGYRVTPDCKVGDEYTERETAECKTLVETLKTLGYSFASHTYYHKYFNSMSAQAIEKDCAMWKRYIAPIVGDTRVLCYPSGEHNAKSAKNEIYKKYGFDVFLCVGDFAGTDHERSSKDARYIYRLPFDGTALRLYGKSYARLADTKAIYDSSRFRPFSYKGAYH